MNKITRYSPCVHQSDFGFYNASMQERELGGYVTYEAHAEKMKALESRLRALESMQKQDFFYHLQKGLGKVADQAIEDMVKELVKKATQTVFKVNPCHELTEEMVSDLVKRMNDNAGGFATGGLVMGINEPETVGCVLRHGQVFINDSLIGFEGIKNAVSHNLANTASKSVKSEESEMACRQPLPMQENCGLMCIKSDVSYFTAGERYSYGYELLIGSRSWFVSSDNYVSDLAVEERWTLEDGGAYMYVKNEITGQYSAVFKKPE